MRTSKRDPAMARSARQASTAFRSCPAAALRTVGRPSHSRHEQAGLPPLRGCFMQAYT